MGIERVSHSIDNVLTEAQARMGLRDTRLLVTWYTNRENKRSVVHSHPYHELVLPIGGSTVRYSVDGSVYLVHVGELVYLTYLRMQHCRKALEEGVSVLNACTESGFPDYSSFLKTFRRLYGITPAEYRAQNRTVVR